MIAPGNNSAYMPVHSANKGHEIQQQRTRSCSENVMERLPNPSVRSNWNANESLSEPLRALQCELESKTQGINANRPSNRKSCETKSGLRKVSPIDRATKRSIYDSICSYDNLLLAFKKARKGKTKLWYVKRFEEQLEYELMTLRHELVTESYEPRPLTRFVIRDPKSRVIHASHFRDRVVHHALCNIIEPIFDKSFIHDSYASRKNKGAHVALDRFKQFQRKVTRNGKLLPYSKDNNMTTGFVLKADIKHYFPSMNHEVLLRILSKKISCERTMNLIRKIVANNPDKSNIGMPIGNLTSQLFANIYLDEMDQFIKHTLKQKYYIRYLDDFVILHESKTELIRIKKHLNDFVEKELLLTLHPDKSKIYPLHKGISFLGFRMFYHCRLPDKSNVRNLERRLMIQKTYLEQGTITREKIEESLKGWMEYARHGDTYHLRYLIESDFKKLFYTKEDQK